MSDGTGTQGGAGGLDRFAPLRDLSAADLAAVSALLEGRKLRAGRTLFREGQEADGLWLVESGSLVIEARRLDQPGRVAAGEALGGLSLVVVGPREVSARAAEADAELLHLSRTAFRRLIEDAPRAGCRILESIATEVAIVVRRGLDERS